MVIAADEYALYAHGYAHRGPQGRISLCSVGNKEQKKGHYRIKNKVTDSVVRK